MSSMSGNVPSAFSHGEIPEVGISSEGKGGQGLGLSSGERCSLVELIISWSMSEQVNVS